MKKPAALEGARASSCVAWTADTSEDTSALILKQSAWIARRLGLPAHLARAVASLAFSKEAR